MNLRELLILKVAGGGGTPLVEKTATGNPVVFTTQIAKRVKSITVPLSYTQEGTGDPYPPGGGKNKFDKDTVVRKDYYAIEYTGEIVTSSASGFTENFIPVNPSTTYTLSGSGGRVIAYYNENKEFISREAAKDTPFSFNVPGNAKYIRIQYRLSDVDMSTWQLEEGSSATSYAPYSNIRPITGVSSFTFTHNNSAIGVVFPAEPGTVYGGSLDLVSGVLTITDAFIEAYNGETLPSTWVSDRDVYSQGTNPTTGAQVVYKLSEPSVVQLDPHSITAIKGTNTSRTDTTGNLTVKYYDKQ